MLVCVLTILFGNHTTTNRTQEVQKHRTPSDAWMVYRNKVYDVSDWYEVRVAKQQQLQSFWFAALL